MATVEVLQRAGCTVRFDPRQTCCGQPAFNSGFQREARTVARQFLDVFGETGDEAIVAPSGSCTAMIHRLPELFADQPELAQKARAVASRTFELGSFLVRELGVEDVGARFDGRLSWHDACHGLRDLGIREEPRRLLRRVAGAELVEMEGPESCCGFGGTFAVKHPEISVAILDRKLESLDGGQVDALVSGDVSCLLHIRGRLARNGSPLRTMHLAEVLASRG